MVETWDEEEQGDQDRGNEGAVGEVEPVLQPVR